MLELEGILRVLVRHEVEFIVVGGIAAILQGSPLTTDDLDVLYVPAAANCARLAEALRELGSRYLDPAGRSIEPTEARLRDLKVHLLKTTLGRIDLLSYLGDDQVYPDLLGRSQVMEIEDLQVRVLDLDAIIETKEQADRPKDRYQLPFLRQLAEELRR
ncbi:MAG: nucleotidyltransferase [Acidobacteriota bacterium]